LSRVKLLDGPRVRVISSVGKNKRTKITVVQRWTGAKNETNGVQNNLKNTTIIQHKMNFTAWKLEVNSDS